MRYSFGYQFVSAAHIILMIFDDVLPFRNLFVGLACTSVYWAYFPTFPSIQLNSFAFIGGCGTESLEFNPFQHI